MSIVRSWLAVLSLLFLATSCRAGVPLVGRVVRDGADPAWPGALVLTDILQRPRIIGLLPEGTEVDILEHLSNNTYTYVVADGIRGWVKKQYIEEVQGVKQRRPSPARRALLFKDIPADHWARRAVERMALAGLIDKRLQRFKGNKTVTRYELAVILDRAQARAELSRHSVERRLQALEQDRGRAPGPPQGDRYRHLLSVMQTLRALEAQSDELRSRLDGVEAGSGPELTRRLLTVEHRLDIIERALGRT